MASKQRSTAEVGVSAAAAVVLLGVVLSTVWASVRTNGRFIYGLDDTYIHMAMAKNVALHGVWGVTPYEFSSASSSPLYTALIAAGYALLGPQELLPLAVNLIAAVGLVLLMASILRSSGYGTKLAAGLALGIALLMPVVALALSGMEHGVHTVVLLAFVALGAKVLAEDRAPVRRDIAVLCGLAAVSVLLRYESLAVLCTFVALALLRRRWVLGAAVLTATVSPVLLFGYFSMSNGGFFLPNSLVMKMRPLPGQDLAVAIKHGWAIGGKELRSLVPRSLLVWADPREAGHILPLLAVATAVLAYRLRTRQRGTGFWSKETLMLTMAVVGAFGHIEFGDFGWLFRYEAYLVSILYIALLAAIRPGISTLASRLAEDVAPRRFLAAGAAAALALAVVMPSAARAVQAQAQGLRATKNIHDQQYQMARFVAKYYRGRTIVASDIGAITYFGDFRLIDLSGLGSTEIARTAKGHGKRPWGPDAVAVMAEEQGAEIAFTFEEINRALIPRQWKRVAAWRIDGNVICADDEVTFYAVDQDPASEQRLRDNIREFAFESPIQVVSR